MFRFPKHQEANDDLKKEIEVLPVLAKCVALRIPRFTFVGMGSDGFQFVGYPIIGHSSFMEKFGD